MRYLILISAFFLVIIKSVSAQDISFNWVNQIGGTAGVDAPNKLVTDENGNVYVAGLFSNTIDFDPTNAVASYTANGGSDVYVVKYNKDGGLAWVKTFGGTGNEGIESITLKKQSEILTDVFITGYFSNTVDFDPSAGVSSYTSLGGTDVFVSKFDADGNFLWTNVFGGTLADAATSVSIDNNNNIYIGGYFRSTVDFNPNTINVNSYTSNGGKDIFVAKYDSDFNFQWVNTIGGTLDDQSNAVKVTTLGTSTFVYSAGNFEDDVDFDPSISSTYTLNGLDSDGYLSKFASNGDFVWAIDIGYHFVDNAEDLAIDDNGYVYVVGSFMALVDFNPSISADLFLSSNGAEDGYVCRYDGDANLSWAKKLGSDQSDNVNSIFLDSYNNVYVTGVFQGTIDLDPSSGVTSYTSVGVQDAFIVELDNQGSYLWSTTIDAYCSGVAIDADASLLFLGYFSSTVDFDISTTNISTLTSNGGVDGFVVKYNCVASTPTITVNNKLKLTSSLAVKYSWYLNGVQISGISTNSFTPTENGTYTVVTTNSVGCKKTSDPVVITTVGIAENDVNNNILVYPNPAKNEVNIVITNQEQENKVYFKDMLGKVVLEHDASFKAKIRLDVSSLQRGIYFVQIGNDVKKIILQ